MRKLYSLLCLAMLLVGFSYSASAASGREYLVAFDRVFVETGTNQRGQTPQQVARQLAREVEGLSGFEYVPDVGFVATLTEAALDTVLVHPDVSMEFECEAWVCTCQGPFDCAWLSWYCAKLGGVSGFDDECYLP